MRMREKKKRGITLNVTLCLFLTARKEFFRIHFLHLLLFLRSCFLLGWRSYGNGGGRHFISVFLVRCGNFGAFFDFTFHLGIAGKIKGHLFILRSLNVDPLASLIISSEIIYPLTFLLLFRWLGGLSGRRCAGWRCLLLCLLLWLSGLGLLSGRRCGRRSGFGWLFLLGTTRNHENGRGEQQAHEQSNRFLHLHFTSFH